MTSDHTSSQYNIALEAMHTNALNMAKMVEKQFKDAITSFKDGDIALAAKVVEKHALVNKLEVNLDNDCRQIILKFQPTANDLRTVMATTKIVTELQRISEESLQIAFNTQSFDIKEAELAFKNDEVILNLSTQVSKMLSKMSSILDKPDDQLAMKLVAKNTELSYQLRTTTRNLVMQMQEDPHLITTTLHRLWGANAMLRIANHIKNVAEHGIFIMGGEDVRYSDYAALKNKNGK